MEQTTNKMEKQADRWAVALAYQKDELKYNQWHHSVDLRLLITDAQNESEALGKAILYFDKEVEAGYRLQNKVILPIYGTSNSETS
jgi:hypothetical protein